MFLKINYDLDDTFKSYIEKKYKPTSEEDSMGGGYLLPPSYVEDKKKMYYYIKKKIWHSDNVQNKMIHIFL